MKNASEHSDFLSSAVYNDGISREVIERKNESFKNLVHKWFCVRIVIKSVC